MRDASRPLGARLSILRELSQGYRDWESFRHIEAMKQLEGSLSKLTAYADATINADVDELASRVEANIAFLKQLLGESQGPKKLPCQSYVIDLIANSERRSKEGNFDDSVLRLYRALEMQAQTRLKAEYNIDTDATRPEQVPDANRSEYERKYRPNEGNNLKLPMEASYMLLHALGDPMGQRFEELHDSFRNVQSQRNSSWLAHGTNVVSEDTCAKLKELAISLCEVEVAELPTFPSLKSD